MKPRSWVRGLNPSLLALAGLCFVLPWIDVQCVSASGPGAAAGNRKLALRQSGLELVTGGYSATMDGQPVTDYAWLEREFLAGHPSYACPLVGAYPVLLLAGLAVAAAVRRPLRRTVAGMALSGLMVIVLVVQICLGFPIADGQSLPVLGGWSFEPAFVLALLLPLLAVFASAVELVALTPRPTAAPPAPTFAHSAEEEAAWRRAVR